MNAIKPTLIQLLLCLFSVFILPSFIYEFMEKLQWHNQFFKCLLSFTFVLSQRNQEKIKTSSNNNHLTIYLFTVDMNEFISSVMGNNIMLKQLLFAMRQSVRASVCLCVCVCEIAGFYILRLAQNVICICLNNVISHQRREKRSN